MAIQLVPDPGPGAAAAVDSAVRAAGVQLAASYPGYASAWRRAGLADGVRRLGAGAETSPYGATPSRPYEATPSRRSARGAIRA